MAISGPRMLFISSSNFIDYPLGGALSFVKHVVETYGNSLALVGTSTDDTPVGQWVYKEIEDSRYRYFSVGRRTIRSSTKPIVPESLRFYYQLSAMKNRIGAINIENMFAGDGGCTVAIRNWPCLGFIGTFHGMRNQLKMSRYWYGGMLAPFWARLRIQAINKAELVLVCADPGEVDEFVERGRGVIRRDKVIAFPTRVDTNVFYPKNRIDLREKMGFDQDASIIVASGRISWVKGWALLLDSYRHLFLRKPRSILIYVGDGEDAPKLKGLVREYGLSDSVRISGFCNPNEVADYLNIADVFVMASYWEGWPTAMVEALACGKPVVCSAIRAAGTLVCEGKNGYVIKERTPAAFAEGIEKALNLTDAYKTSLRIGEVYALKYLARDLGRLWRVFAELGRMS